MKSRRLYASAGAGVKALRPTALLRELVRVSRQCLYVCARSAQSDAHALELVVNVDEDEDDVETLMTPSEREAARLKEMEIEWEIAQRIEQDALLSQTRAIMKCVPSAVSCVHQVS